MNIRKRIAALAAAVCLFAGGGLLAAAPASAGSCTNVAGVTLCGKVVHSSSGPHVASCSVKASSGWPAQYGRIVTIGHGLASNRYYADADAIWISSGCYKAPFVRNTWVKIYDGQTITVVG